MSSFQQPKYPTEYEIKILQNQEEILSLLKRIIGKPQVPSVESVIHLRETGTNTPDILTREQSTQSPISSNDSPRYGEEFKDDPIYARANQAKPYSCPADA